jgi:hypothetical protein
MVHDEEKNMVDDEEKNMVHDEEENIVHDEEENMVHDEVENVVLVNVILGAADGDNALSCFFLHHGPCFLHHCGHQYP